MIVGQLVNWDKEKHLYAPAIQKAVAWLQQADLAALPTGRHEIDGDKLYAMVNEYTTEPKEKRRAEAHRKYVDVQCLVQGEEIIGYAPLREGLEVLEDSNTSLKSLIVGISKLRYRASIFSDSNFWLK